MFQSLTNNLTKIFDKIKNRGNINAGHLEEVMRDIKIALLEADVSLPVVKKFIETVSEKAQGQKIIKSVSPANMIVKIINDEIIELLSPRDGEGELNLAVSPPASILVVGLQGSGKTSASAKLALYLKNQNKKILLVSLDVYRPAAQEQLAILANDIGVDALEIISGQQPIEITKRALEISRLRGYDVVIYDSAGRLHINEEMIEEVSKVKNLVKPSETILVVDSMTGQDSINIAKAFDEKLSLSGVILSRIDGDSRGGAALSIRYETGRPIKFLSTGEKPAQFEKLDAKRIASRILDMGDVVSLVEKAASIIDEQEAEKAAARLQKGQFDMTDYLSQLKMMGKMGGLGGVMSMLPGLSRFKEKVENSKFNDGFFKKQEAIILSMTKKERRNPALLNASRKQRIALGSGTSVQHVNNLVKQFTQVSTMMKKVAKMDPKTLMRSFGNMF